MQNQSNSTPQSENSSTSNTLEEVVVDSLDELINRTPNLSDPEVDIIVNYLRSQKTKFAQQEAAPKPKKSPRHKGPVISADELLKAIDLDL